MKTIIISIIIGVIIMSFVQTLSSAVSDSDPALPSRTERSPQFRQGKFDNGAGDALDMSFSESVSAAWEFFFHRK